MLPDGLPSLISPWYINGNILRYLESCPKVNRRSLALDVAEGLNYLHSIPVAHGDLKGENILVNAEGRASLCDFGMSQFIDEARQITGFTTTSGCAGGTDRFMCPELFEDGTKSTATDMWAFGCLVVQILTGKIPYQRIMKRYALLLAVIRGELPFSDESKTVGSSLWVIIVRCWSMSPENRPTVPEVLHHFKPPKHSIMVAGFGRLIRSQMLSHPCRSWGVVRFSFDGISFASSSDRGTISIWKTQKRGILKLPFTMLYIRDSVLGIPWSAPRPYLLGLRYPLSKFGMLRRASSLCSLAGWDRQLSSLMETQSFFQGMTVFSSRFSPAYEELNPSSLGKRESSLISLHSR